MRRRMLPLLLAALLAGALLGSLLFHVVQVDAGDGVGWRTIGESTEVTVRARGDRPDHDPARIDDDGADDDAGL